LVGQHCDKAGKANTYGHGILPADRFVLGNLIMRGITDDGKIPNIAGDYIAYGVRARASELVTRELGHQSEREVQNKLGLEINEDRFTRLDRSCCNKRRTLNT
jgi:type IV secretory pathway VirD2 relaxase